MQLDSGRVVSVRQSTFQTLMFSGVFLIFLSAMATLAIGSNRIQH